nr:unnamed protein product [Callosobruchus chinensis]
MCARWLANDAPKHIQFTNLIFLVTNWRKAITDVIKPTLALHFKINYCRRIISTRGTKGTILVHREPNYSEDINNPLGITKRGKQISNI